MHVDTLAKAISLQNEIEILESTVNKLAQSDTLWIGKKNGYGSMSESSILKITMVDEAEVDHKVEIECLKLKQTLIKAVTKDLEKKRREFDSL